MDAGNLKAVKFMIIDNRTERVATIVDYAEIQFQPSS